MTAAAQPVAAVAEAHGPEHVLLLDLETDADGRILKAGGLRGSQSFAWSGRDQHAAVQGLERLAGGAAVVVGHYVAEHDLPILQRLSPNGPLSTLPIIDTLYLSPLCFPENPYHRLVKDYKLARASVNDPLADSQLAFRLYLDEREALAGLQATEPALFRTLHGLVGGLRPGGSLARGLNLLFGELGGQLPDESTLLDMLRGLVGRWGCATAAAHLGPSDLADETLRWSMAYALAWLRVAGHQSVLPAWVRRSFPGVPRLIVRFRDSACAAPDCPYCRVAFDPVAQLRRYFRFDAFRPEPVAPDGGSQQQRIVEAGMAGRPLLAILPTGGGKSLGFQLPALVRSFRRGTLTIVLSPLQALMKDQVDGLTARTGTPFAAALSGLLTPLERADVLRRVRQGDISILYVSPEQLRNRSFATTIAQREIGGWVFDEAHCLSKWGHDFRPDYLYAGRFILGLARQQQTAVPPIACFTATAKPEVIEEIRGFFAREVGQELELFESTVERINLRFEVRQVSPATRANAILELLTERLNPAEGGAIVFRATRRLAEETAEYLQSKGWQAHFFHAGMAPFEKKRIQDGFIHGDIPVICATNAFGMGIDKENVRLVIHGDTPGSLENYLQEAGRAGRDRLQADCVLLHDEEDAEQQFRFHALGELSRQDLAAILRGLRRAQADGEGRVVLTAGELLRSESTPVTFDVTESGADTKVRTAVSWLERSGFIERDENVTSVFQARLNVRSLDDAGPILDRLNLSAAERALWREILEAFMGARPDQGLRADELMGLPAFGAWLKQDAQWQVREAGPGWKVSNGPVYSLTKKVIEVLDAMSRAGLMRKSTLMTAFVRHKVKSPSRDRLAQLDRLERATLALLAEEAPDPEGWLSLDLRLLNQRLTDAGESPSVDVLRNLIAGLEHDGRGLAGTRGSLDLRYVGQHLYRVRLYRTWSQIVELAERRRKLAGTVLTAILDKLPAATPPGADVLVAFSFEELTAAVESDLVLRNETRDPVAGVERALLFLHELEVIRLQQGLAVFRAAMTIRVLPDTRRLRYTQEHFAPLAQHYLERRFQVHVMNAYAQHGLERIQEALKLVVAYFTLGRKRFIEQYFAGNEAQLERATTAASWQRIVEELGDPDQRRLVEASDDRNLLVLAGPGAGKTRTVVHRSAFLLRVRRVPAHAILVVCFNHSAAVELRQRLQALVGTDAFGVTVQTYHGLAMRLTGTSYAALAERAADRSVDFDALIPQAAALLRGETELPGVEPDAVRDRLLAGFRYILVDEYQDIDEPQYALISALAGRRLADEDARLTLMAVGDDDQSIYGFRGANVAHIRRFQDDYQADLHYLVRNYRSTRHIIAAANALIAPNRDRMKTERPIAIDRRRQMQPAGGPFGARDPFTGGRVQLVAVAVADAGRQAAAALDEAQRLAALGVPWDRLAVLGRARADLARFRALAEAAGVPVRWCAERERLPPLHRVRECARLLEALTAAGSSIEGPALAALHESVAAGTRATTWTRLLRETIAAWRSQTEDTEQPVPAVRDFIHEALAERRREPGSGEGVTLATVHGAKGTEHDHVLIVGDWSNLGSTRQTEEEERRTLYVGMTRARHTLVIFDRRDRPSPLFAPLHAVPHVIHRVSEVAAPDDALLSRHYDVLNLSDLFISYAAGFHDGAPIHAALARLAAGDTLRLRAGEQELSLVTEQGHVVARLSSAGAAAWRPRVAAVQEIRVLAMVRRYREDSEPDYRAKCRVDRWELPVCEVVWNGEG